MILLAFGTRPEWIKIKPVIDKIHGIIPYKIICTGQHKNIIDKSTSKYNISNIEIAQLGNRLDDIVCSILRYGDKLYENIDYVMVQGDTTSAFAVALGAFHRKIKVIHLEAGLRSLDKYNPYPEEFNRVSIGALTDIYLCPTEISKNNILLAYGLKANVHVVGNTVLDNLVGLKPVIEDFVLVTMHRRENHNELPRWFSEINNIAKHSHLKFVMPLHPNPEVTKHAHLLSNVKIINPLSHEDCIDHIRRCAMIITDSGGIQEEASFLKKKCIVCRKTTERVEGINSFATVCVKPEYLHDFFTHTKIELVNQQCPYGDGYASDRILEILKGLYNEPVYATK